MVVNHKSLNPFRVQELENEKISRTFHGRLLWNMGSDILKWWTINTGHRN